MPKTRHSVSLLVLCVALLGGCVADDGPAFFISGNLAPVAGGSSSTCVVDSSSPLILRGQFDVSVGNGYLMNPLFNNQLVPRGASAPPRANPNGVLIEGAEVEIQDSAGNAIDFGGLPNPFTVSSYVYVPTSSGATSPGQAVGTFEVIPPAYVGTLASMVPMTGSRALVLVSLKAFGSTTGDVAIDASEFVWPVDLCNGCLFLPAGPDDEVGCCTPGQDLICYYAP